MVVWPRDNGKDNMHRTKSIEACITILDPDSLQAEILQKNMKEEKRKR